MPHPRIRSLWLAGLSLVLLAAPVLSDEAPLAHGVGAGSTSSAPLPGAAVWARCAVCHGADGQGLADGTFPKLAGQHASVVRTQLEAIRTGERPNPVMQPHVTALTDRRDVDDVAALVAAMPRDAVCYAGPGGDLERGERLYDEACASCHGAAGQGDAEEGVPWVACQHHAYLLRRVRQLASWGANAHPETSPPLARLTDADLIAVIDYAARLPVPAPVASETNETNETSEPRDSESPE